MFKIAGTILLTFCFWVLRFKHIFYIKMIKINISFLQTNKKCIVLNEWLTLMFYPCKITITINGHLVGHPYELLQLSALLYHLPVSTTTWFLEMVQKQ